MSTPVQPTNGFTADAERFYSLLQAVQEQSRDDAQTLLPVAEDQVEKHRAIVAELRQLLTHAEADLDHWATTAANLRASVNPDLPAGGAELGGRALATIAATVLETSGKPQPIHYRDLQEQIQLAGYTISGVDAQATLLTALGRSPNWEAIGGRTGLWKLANTDTERTP
jgi:hypothetical protein